MTGETTSRVPIDARLRQIAEAGEPMAKGYRHHGDEAWTPGAEGPMETGEARAARRRAEYLRLRARGARTPEAARAVGIATATGYRYNREMRDELRAARDAGAGPAGGAP